MTSAQKLPLSAQLQHALALWVELTGVDPGATKFSTLGDYTVSQMHEAVREALELDQTNITGHLLLDALASAYFRDRKFSVDDLLRSPEQTAAYVAKAREFIALARSPDITDIGDQFALNLRQALRHYRADTPEVMKIVENRHELAFLRRDALRSISRLRVDQFLKGVPERAEVKPAYHRAVHQFWNINSLINAACHQPSGVTMNLIRDPDDFQSYFAFAIRNGGNLFVLSDVPEHCHPLQRYMSRRPDRELSRRAGRNWFPYDLLNLKFDEESGMLFADAEKRTALIPLQQEFDRLKAIADLDPREVIWIVMMFDLILDKFWNKGYQAPQLSYTGQMVREQPLLEEVKRANLPVTGYQPLDLPALTVAAVSGAGEAAIGSADISPNKWLEDRYGARVTDDLLNLVSRPQTEFYLPPPPAVATARGNRSSHANHENALVTANFVSVSRRDDDRLPFWNKEGRLPLHALNPSTFGTREELENDRTFLARHNMAKAIQRLANEEYFTRENEIKDWWKASIEKNIEALYRMAGLREVVMNVGDGLNDRNVHAIGSRLVGTYPLAKVYSHEELEGRSSTPFSSLYLHKGISRGSTYLCHINGTASSYRAIFQPQCAADLALLTGCAIEQLPDVLQHWVAHRSHMGNHILSRIDPMAWALHDPWSEMCFVIVLFLSKRALRKLETESQPVGPKSQ